MLLPNCLSISVGVATGVFLEENLQRVGLIISQPEGLNDVYLAFGIDAVAARGILLHAGMPQLVLEPHRWG